VIFSKIFGKKKEEEKPKKLKPVFSTDDFYDENLETSEERLSNALKKTFQRELVVEGKDGKKFAMDNSLKPSLFGDSGCGNFPIIVSEAQLSWYASQGFIGHQTCAIIAQHWLVNKACTVPARDAIRNGYNITVNDGNDIDEDIISEIRKQDKKYNLIKNMLQFVRMGRIFGIRLALFKVDSTDPEYYEKPFNIDGVTPGSYKGIAQIDPYWTAPQLLGNAVTDPTQINFYEPVYWMISGKRIHRSHFVIMINGEVPDILKPTYYWGGISVPQEIYERIYAAERTANEAPQLALTKRSCLYKTDMANAIANQPAFESRVAFTTRFMDNYGVRVIDKNDEFEFLDTNLADLDNLIMTQYQLVAAIANVPADKLLGTAPKGFNATGEFQQKNYHEELESIQCHYLTPLLERHHELLIRSYICPKYGISPFEIEIKWTELNSVDAKEQAEINKLDAETDSILVQSGAVDGRDVRNKLVSNKNSGFNGLDTDDLPENNTQEDFPDDNEDNPESTEKLEIK
jgi:phage-related protein (TIGR01555 family)